MDELIIRSTIVLARMTSEVGEIVLAGGTASGNLERLKVLVGVTVPEPAQQAWLVWCGQAKAAFAERNAFIHSMWGIDSSDMTVFMIRQRQRGAKAAPPATKYKDATEMNAVSDKLGLLVVKLIGLWNSTPTFQPSK